MTFDGIEESGRDWHKRNDLYYRYLYLASRPSDIPFCWVKLLESAPGVRCVSISVEPERDAGQLNELMKIATTRSADNQNSDKSDILKKSRNNIIKRLADDTSRLNESTFRVAVYVELVTDTKNLLKMATKYVKSLADDMGIDLASVQAQPAKGIETVAPTGIIDNNRKINHSFNITAVAFTSFIYFNPDPERIKELFDNHLDVDFS